MKLTLELTQAAVKKYLELQGCNGCAVNGLFNGLELLLEQNEISWLQDACTEVDAMLYNHYILSEDVDDFIEELFERKDHA